MSSVCQNVPSTAAAPADMNSAGKLSTGSSPSAEEPLRHADSTTSRAARLRHVAQMLVGEYLVVSQQQDPRVVQVAGH